MKNEFAQRRTWGPAPKYPSVIDYCPTQDEDEFIVVAGPCSVESDRQIKEIASLVASAGATHLRGGVFRAGTYPGANFGWVDRDLIKSYKRAASANGLRNIIEILEYDRPEMLEFILENADCVQVGARQMQNYTLLRRLGKTGKTVFLKRNPGATLDEWLGAAEYIIASGGKPILIERGSATHANHVRWDLSISMIPAVQAITKIPIIVDASHGTGRRDLVSPMTLAGIAAGANGMLVEVHYDPKNSLSDADQAIEPTEFFELMRKTKLLRHILKKESAA